MMKWKCVEWRDEKDRREKEGRCRGAMPRLLDFRTSLNENTDSGEYIGRRHDVCGVDGQVLLLKLTPELDSSAPEFSHGVSLGPFNLSNE